MTLADRIVLMKDGRIEQMGTPEEIYQAPRTVFAAGFIGTPNMNFLQLQMTQEWLGDNLVRFTAPAGLRSGEVTVGIRPGSFRINQDAQAFRGTVERNEFHGETRLICLKNDRHEINISVPADIRPAIGEVLGVEVASSDLHVFDPGTGLRLI
jgi:multiple sugar transport system ATP-binding protein